MDSGPRIQDLRDEATRLLTILGSQARRAYVVEVTGTPKAGKSTGISMLENFFKDCGFRVHVLRERAALCPLKMKGHFFFNTWTSCTMLAELLEVVDSPCDLVILDRGFLDALIWLELQRRRGQVSEKERRAFEQFMMLDRWRTLVDVTVLMSVKPSEAMQREQRDKLISRAGSLMNLHALAELNTAIASVAKRHAQSLPLIRVDAGGIDQKRTIGHIVETLLPRMSAWADPFVASVRRSELTAFFGTGKAVAWDAARWRKLTKHAISTRRRSQLEGTDEFVQLVACGIQTREGGIFAFARSPDDKRAPYGLRTIWQGCHIAIGRNDRTTLKRVQRCLEDRLRQNLHLEIQFAPRPVGFVWEPENQRESRHMGVVFEVPIEDELVGDHLREKAFKTNGRGHQLLSRFSKPTELLSKQEDLSLEPWSCAILEASWLK